MPTNSEKVFEGKLFKNRLLVEFAGGGFCTTKMPTTPGLVLSFTSVASEREWRINEIVYKVNEMVFDMSFGLRGTCAYVGENGQL